MDCWGSYGIKIIFFSLISVLLLSSTSQAIFNNDKDAEVLNVAIIGDSYSAGNGAGLYYHPQKSFRSYNSWGNLYINELKLDGVKVISHNLSFNGNKTGDILMSIRNERHPNNKDRPFERFPHESIDMVLMTAGGKDADFAEIVEKCFVFLKTDEKTCKEKVDNANKLIDDGIIKKKTLEIFSEIQSKAPRATDVIMVGYPLLSIANSHIFSSSYNASNVIRTLGKKAEAHQKQSKSTTKTQNLTLSFRLYAEKISETRQR